MKMEIQEIIKQHQVWLKDKTKGAQADFSGMVLRSTDFSGNDLRFANFSDTNLRFANFCDANLSGADLSGADLSGSDLGNANLSDTNFSDADLSWAKIIDAEWDGLHFPQTQNNRIVNYHKGAIFCGCFKGSLAEFKESVSKKKNDCPRKKAYLEIIKQIENEK